MSLNGLDASAVVEAHQAALADPGGWFLLKYASRDTVELLGRGTGGVGDAKIAVEQYEEKSPLYGIVHYRRKRVMLKYVPVGTSRLLQVRLTVQFQSVADAFPHDAVFSFTAPSEMTESALGLSAMLPPTTTHGTSMSSAASLKHRRLDEISEGTEEPPQTAQIDSGANTVTMSPPKRSEQREFGHSVQTSMASSMDSLPASALKAKALLARRKEAEAEADRASEVEQSLPPPPPKGVSPPTPLQVPAILSLDKSLPATPQPTPPSSRHGLSRLRPGTLAPPVPSESPVRVSFEKPVDDVYHSSHLTAKESSTISQWNDQVAAYTTPFYKPKKKKLGPRPHVEPTHRPKTSNTAVAILPQSVRASSRQAFHTGNRPGSQQSSRSVPSRFVHTVPGPPPPLPVSTQLPPIFRSTDLRKPPSIASTTVTDSSTATPEKLRLMRALQTRKRNHLLTQRAITSQSQRPPTSLEEESTLHSAYQTSRALTPVLSNPPTNELVSRLAEGRRNNITPINASPTSATTASGTHSTKPSSVSAETDARVPVTQPTDDTGASLTPKASHEPEEKASSTLARRTNLQEQDDDETSEEPAAPWSVANDISGRRNGAITPPGPETIIQSATPESVRRSDTTETVKVETERPPVKSLELPPRISSRSNVVSLTKSLKHASLLGKLKAPSSADVSVNSDDDAFMDELQNATVYEAKPVSVARSPATPTMRKLSVDKVRTMTRTNTTESMSNVVGNSPEAPESTPTSMRSNSAAVKSGEASVPLSKKSSLGTGISRRIKALEVVKSRMPSQSSSQAQRDPSVQKSVFASLKNRASVIAHLSSSSQHDAKSDQKSATESKTLQSSHEQLSSNGPFMEPVVELDEAYAGPKKGETISVTARIVRDSGRSATSAARYQNDSPMGLHRSPLIVEHERSTIDRDTASFAASLSARNLDQHQYSPHAERSRFSFSSHKSGSTVKQHVPDGRTSRMSTASKDKRSSKTLSETSSIADDRRTSKTSRMMKRVSGIGNRFGNISHMLSGSKDQLPQETIMEQAEDERRQSVASSMLQVIDIGDVNVQFPETLLWKRRFVRIDDQGFLIFSPPTDNAHIPTTNRKFHLSDLKAPALPDLEREEMSWSILLELKNGGCIQCACESKTAQGQILRMLLDAHDAYNSLYT